MRNSTNPLVPVASSPPMRPRWGKPILRYGIWRFLLLLGLAGAFASKLCAQQFENVSVAVGLAQEEKKSWGNPIWGDINNDGYLDLIVPTHGLATSHGPFVYLNNAGNTFTDIRDTCGIEEASELDDKDWHGFGFADYNDDGNLDVYVSEGAKGQQGGTIKRDLLFRGNGDGTFQYVSDVAGIVTSSDRGRCSFFFDADNDGKLDLFVKNYDGVNILYHNTGGGVLQTVAGADGLEDATFGIGFGGIIALADYDLDGLIDMAISADGNTLQLYHQGSDGTFLNVSPGTSGLIPQFNSKGIAWGDYNNDGFPDLFVARAEQGSEITGTSLYLNNGNGTFTDVTEAAGVTVDGTCWAGVWGDYDNDGFLDLFVTNAGTTGQGPGNANKLFHNNGDGTFTDMAKTEGLDMEDGVALHKTAAWADYNNDGFLDLIVKDGAGGEDDNGASAMGLHSLFKNKGNSNHFLKINLRGVQSNLHGIGARVKVTTSTGVVYRQNDGGGGGSYASQSCEPVHVGIGSALFAAIEVDWPSGVVDNLTSVPANSTLTIIEGSVPPAAHAQNISTRLDVKTGAQVGIGGFIVTGTSPTKVLVRGLGPSLTASGVQGVLEDPVLELHEEDGTTLTNDNWRDTQESEIEAAELAPTNDAESALVADLAPGAYTVILDGKNGGSGIGLVEAFDLGRGVVSELANVSTRGFAGSGDNVLIGGVIIGPSDASAATTVVRAIGPSLAQAGVDGTLLDPVLELHDGAGEVIASNDDWQDDPAQAAELTALGLNPTDPRESALDVTLDPGDYTAVVSGKNGGTGVALVEVYEVK